MSSPKLGRFTALPPLEQSVLALLVAVHTPLNRARLGPWLKTADLKNASGRQFTTAELTALVERWVTTGFLRQLGATDQYAHAYAINDELRHQMAARLAADGKLAAMAKLVRQSVPLLNPYDYSTEPDRLARELFLSMHITPVPNLERAVQMYRPGRDESPGDVYLRAFGFFAPRDGLKRIGPGRSGPYLESALRVAARDLCALGNGLLEYVSEAAPQLDEAVLASAAQLLALQGKQAAALTLLGSSSGPHTAAARAFVALAKSEFAEGRRHARSALELARSQSDGERVLLSSTLWPFLLVLLFTGAGDAEASQLAHELLLSCQKREPERAVLLRALGRLERFFTPDATAHADDELAFTEEAREWIDLIVCVLVRRFVGAAPSPTLEKRLLLAKKVAHSGGFSYLAEELSRLGTDPSTGMARMYLAEEPWQRALRALEGAIELAGTSPDAPVSKETEERLVWSLLAEPDGGHQLAARIQTRTLTGFTSGRQINWKRLYETDSSAPFLTAEDRRVITQIRLVRDVVDPNTIAHVMAEQAPLALAGHPHVFADHECKVPVEIVRGEVRVDVRQQDGQIIVALIPDACLQREVVCVRDGVGRVLVYALTAEQRVIAQQLTPTGLRLPEDAKDSAQVVLGKLVSHFALSSELALEAPDVEDVLADSRIHLQLRRAGAGLSIRWCVAPLGSAPTFTPGVGSANVLGTRMTPEGKKKTVRCTRDFDAELNELERLFAASPTLAERDAQSSELRLPELTRCLDLLWELRTLGSAVVVEWPDGQPLSIVAERDLRDMKLQLHEQGAWLKAEGELVIDQDLKLSFKELLQRAHRREGRFLALDDGRFLALSEALQRSLESAGALSRVKGDTVELHPLALFGVTGLSDAQLEVDSKVSDRLQRVREAAELQPEVPHAFEASLRPYQQEGYAFMSRLAHWGAGACLADDMGLGKTLQTLALLVERASHGPALVVAPTSVCANWLDEARKFAPTLRVVQFGTGTRERVVKELGPFDVLVCSYGVLQQEREQLAAKRFEVIVLDEAQAIKNASTNRAKAAMELNGATRIALTGTPIENHLGELWSILSFVNPGLLGSAKGFEERFLKPIQRDGNRQAAQLLRRTISPFVLRRRKSEVLDDLPEKTVITLRVEPSPEERALFAALREQALVKMVDSGKPAEARMRLLAELTRMRRAACHPDLVMPAAGIASSKLATLESLLSELREGGHRALVFSQFVDYLSIVRARLETLGISYQYLDGSSTTQQRSASVNAFQAGNSDVFLISLKAGGFGLNLTAADYVVHLDPWWNPAVEDQASDRAHRIGQTRPVTIYRLVMEGSIEEKILALHATKRQLADDLLEGAASGPSLGVDELMDLLSEANAESYTDDVADA
jgi:hypothetical protein